MKTYTNLWPKSEQKYDKVVARPGSRSGKMLCHSRSIWAFWELRSWIGVASSHNWSSPARWICHRCPKTLDCFEFPLCTRLNTCILGSGCTWRVCSLRILGSGALTPSKASCKHLWSWFPVLKIDRHDSLLASLSSLILGHSNIK